MKAVYWMKRLSAIIIECSLYETDEIDEQIVAENNGLTDFNKLERKN